jgi:hypothetical protein
LLFSCGRPSEKECVKTFQKVVARMKALYVVLLVLVLTQAAAVGAYQQPGAPAPGGPSGPSAPGGGGGGGGQVLGMSPTLAIFLGLILLVVVILAVAMASRGGSGATVVKD